MTPPEASLYRHASAVAEASDALAGLLSAEVLDTAEEAIGSGAPLAEARALRIIVGAYLPLARSCSGAGEAHALRDAAGTFLVPWPLCRQAFRGFLAGL